MKDCNDPYRTEALVSIKPNSNIWSRIKTFLDHTFLGKYFYCDKCKESKLRKERNPMYRLWYLYTGQSDVYHPHYCKNCCNEWWKIENKKERNQKIAEEVERQLIILRAQKEAKEIFSKEIEQSKNESSIK